MGDTKQNTPISAQITALRLKPERISFCDRFADIERKPTLSNMIKQVQITDRKVSGMLKRTSINCKIHINLFFFAKYFVENVTVFLEPILSYFSGCYFS